MENNRKEQIGLVTPTTSIATLGLMNELSHILVKKATCAQHKRQKSF